MKLLQQKIAIAESAGTETSAALAAIGEALLLPDHPDSSLLSSLCARLARGGFLRYYLATRQPMLIDRILQCLGVSHDPCVNDPRSFEALFGIADRLFVLQVPRTLQAVCRWNRRPLETLWLSFFANL